MGCLDCYQNLAEELLRAWEKFSGGGETIIVKNSMNFVVDKEKLLVVISI